MKNRFNLFTPFMIGLAGFVLRDKPNEGGTGGSMASENTGENADKNPSEGANEGESLNTAETGSTGDNSKINDEEAKLLKEIMGQKKRLAESDRQLQEAQDRLSLFDGIDPEKARNLIDQEQTAEQERLEAQGEFERVKQMMAEQHQKEIEGVKAENDRLKGEISARNDRIDALTIGDAFANSNFISEELIFSPSKSRQIWGDYVGLNDDKVVVYDKPASSASRTILVDASGEPVSFDEGLRRLVEADPEKNTILKTKMKPGSSSSSTTNPSSKAKPNDPGKGAARILASLGNDQG